MERLAKKCSPFASTSTLHLSSRPKAIFLKSPKENKQLSPSGQKRSRETSEHEEDSFSVSTKKPNVEKELEKHVFWHHENCHSCKTLQRIEEKHMARLQNHFNRFHTSQKLLPPTFTPRGVICTLDAIVLSK